ncbi:hypothetical protein [Mycobacterium sp. OTB74]|uniref:hypothetical protein n=1 Tax=Mycobacterium sp. OTB74 TaxID=1853452 RepID=UPI002473F161|nr:hypothetical protein [Mycobacterium sp. OTB74]MDH6243083.1 hypothetical protein [Mycobacterium sp. OTB74]
MREDARLQDNRVVAPGAPRAAPVRLRGYLIAALDAEQLRRLRVGDSVSAVPAMSARRSTVW